MTRREELESTIINASKAYYVGKPIMSDSDFDELVEEYKSLSDESSDDTPDITKVTGFGYEVTSRKVNHLSNVHGISDKRKVTMDYVIKENSILTPKLDGGSLELQYVDGKLTKAVTRGNGLVGIDVTNNVRYSQGIVYRLKDNTFTGNIIGEYVISDEDLINSEYDSISQRNIPNGFLNRNKVSKSESELFTFIAYKIGASDGGFSTRLEVLEFLRYENFITVPCTVCDGTTTYGDYIKVNFNTINGKHYLYDGIVSDGRMLGVSKSNHLYVYEYTNEKAYKVVTDKKITTVKDITWNTTRTGRIVPVAVIDQVTLSGAQVSKVTLNNYKYVIENKIGIGSNVEVVRSGEVIPLITKVITTSDNINLPTKCPNCDNPNLVVEGRDLICNSKDCRDSDSLYRFISVMNYVPGIGSKLIYRLIDLSESTGIDQFLSIDVDYVKSRINNEVRGKVTKSKLIDCIDSIFYADHQINEFLVAMNIKGLSWKTADKLAELGIYNALLHNDRSILKSRAISEKVKNYLFYNMDKIIDRMDKLYIVDKVHTSDTKSSKEKLKVCITGSLEGYTKSKFYSEYSEYIEESSVKDCDYLVCNDTSKNSSKYKSAIKLDKNIVSQSTLVNIINGMED